MTFAHPAQRFSVTFDKIDPVDHDRKLYHVHVTGAAARTFKVSIPASSSAVPQPSPTSKIEQWFTRSLRTERSCGTFLTSRSSEISATEAHQGFTLFSLQVFPTLWPSDCA